MILLGNSKSGERHYQNKVFPPIGGEYRLPFVLRKVRTSLRKSNFPTESFIAASADLSASGNPTTYPDYCVKCHYRAHRRFIGQHRPFPSNRERPIMQMNTIIRRAEKPARPINRRWPR